MTANLANVRFTPESGHSPASVRMLTCLFPIDGRFSQNGLEIGMPNLESDFGKLATDARQMAEENARLRKINSQMISALEYVLPLLQQGLPATVDFDWTKEAVAKVQDALAEAERD